jgi:uncharacterized protein
MSVVADTGFIVSSVFTTDKWHKACVELYKQEQEIYLPQTTLAEAMYLIGQGGGNRMVAAFLEGLLTRNTKYRLIALEPEDIKRTFEILRQYADSRVDFVDATVLAVAERLNITTILTLDKRDFGLIRPRHTAYMTLLP